MKTSNPTLATRINKAAAIVEDGRVRHVNSCCYAVSGSQQLPYTVRFIPMICAGHKTNSPGWKCTCKDNAPVVDFGGSVQKTCKHIIAVVVKEARDTYPMSEAEQNRLQTIWEAANPDFDNGVER